MTALPLAMPTRPAPDLRSYDVLLVNSSAGKDSLVMLDEVVEQAKALDLLDRVVVVHADLGRVEWQGTRELAERQAVLYGVRFEVVSRVGRVKRDGVTPQGDLLDQVAERGMWPDSRNRYCTSDHKRNQVQRLIVQLGREVRERTGGSQPRLLNCLGMRADESPARSKLAAFEHDERASNGTRHVDRWLPLHGWTTEQVWERIRSKGLPYHPAYDLGMPRLSCCFCIFAPKRALVLAGTHNRELLDAYVVVEEQTGHKFRQDVSLREVREAVRAGESAAGPISSWRM